MSQYKIEWLERKETSTGKKKIDATVKDEQGVNADVTIWADFPGFAELNSGMTIEAELRPASDPKYRPSLSPVRAQKAQGGGYRQKLIDDNMEKKNASISHFQANKEESIKLAGAQRDAVLVVVNLYKEIAEDKIMTPSEKDSAIKKKIVEFRDYFLSAEFNTTLPF